MKRPNLAGFARGNTSSSVRGALAKPWWRFLPGAPLTTTGRHTRGLSAVIAATANNVLILPQKELRYEAIPEYPREEIPAAVERDDPEELLYAMLSAALYDRDVEWAQEVTPTT